jgi:tetratricopeptide (TPR) repeat protein
MRVPDQRSRELRAQKARARALLGRLPPPSEPAFPQAAREALEAMGEPEPSLRLILEDQKERRGLRFAALYGLLLRLRREERFGEYSELVRRCEGEFGTEPYFHTFRAIVARVRGDLASLRSAVEYSRRAVELLPSRAAVVHQLAAFWIEYLERLDAQPAERDLEEVERHVDRAIALTHGTVAHYFETKGRVLALRGEFEAARSAVAQAIEAEPRGSRDYLRRLTQYQTTRVRVDVMEERVRWHRAHQRFRDELTEFKGQQLQLLGLLAAIVAFIVTAGNIAVGTSGADGIRLIVVASGAIAVVFGTFSLVNNSSVGKVAVAIMVGLALIGGAIALPASWLQ